MRFPPGRDASAYAFPMARLGIDLQDGFQGDEVIVTIDGDERFRKRGVMTKRVLGLAANTRLEVPEGTVNVQISIPSRGVEKQLALDVSGDAWLGVSVSGDEITTTVSEKKFGYG